MKKKAQSLSINTVIIAAMALLVMVIIIAIVVERMRDSNEGLGSCRGTCATSCDSAELPEGKWVKLPTGTCPGDKPDCCIRYSGTGDSGQQQEGEGNQPTTSGENSP